MFPVIAFILATPAVAIAADAADPVLVRRGETVVTKSDYEAELQRIPKQDRAAFEASTRRNRELIERILVTRELAAQAREKKLDQDAMVKRRLALEEDRLLAAVLLAQVEDRAAQEFAAQSAKFERVAREQYVIGKAAYTTPETLMLTQVFFSAEKDGFDGAKKRADEAYAKIRGGADIGDLAATVSDDTSKRDARGRVGPLARADMYAQVAEVAFALTKPGDISEPVKSPAGWHILRLDARNAGVQKSFDEVKGDIMSQLRDQHLAEAKNALMRGIAAKNEAVVDEAAIDALRLQRPTP
jgi:parvulin-like peptidyl-prolyl isomerase